MINLLRAELPDPKQAADSCFRTIKV